MRKMSVIVLACLFFAAFLLPAGAAARTDRQTVKIGYYYDSDYFYKDDHGNYSGYDVEYFYEISKYTDWQYQYVDFSSFEAAYAALEAGEIDILPSLFYTQERADSLLLSSYDMGSVYVTIIVSPSNTSIAYNDVAALQGRKVGILSGAVDGEKYREWSAGQGLQTDIVSLPSTEALLNALDSGELDAVAISYLGSSSAYRIVQEFSPMEMYFGMPKDRGELMKQLDKALGEISIETPDFSSSLYSKYYIANQKQIPVFTEEEKNYIASCGTLSVAVMNNCAPFSYAEKDGTMTGAIIDYFKRISQLSGLQFSFRGYQTQTDIINALKSGGADIGGYMIYDAVEATSDQIYLTNSYINLALTLVTLRGAGEARTLAVPSYLESIVKGSFANTGIAVRLYDTPRQCIDALKDGGADGAVLNTFSVNYYMNNSRVNTYNVTAQNGLSYRASAGISTAADKTLLSVLNRCIRYSNVTTLNELITKYSQANTSSFQATLNRIPPVWLFSVAAIMCCFVIVLVILSANVARRQKEKLTLAAQQSEVARKAAEITAAERAADEKNAFLSNISHDMRTPLNAVIGFAGLGRKAASAEKKDEYFSKILSSGALLNSLIDDTLTLSKTNSGKLELHPEPVRSRELFESVIVPIREAAAKKNITFTSDDSRALDRVILADKLCVQKIFLNLLSNAVKYTPEGGHVRLLIYNEPAANGGADSLLVVSDDGIGMSEEFVRHMYEPFSQEKRHGYESVGTGLGLSIVKEMVDLMGGTIEVQSEAGRGTTFTVRFHFQAADESAETRKTQRPAPALRLGGKKLLLCEDNALNREIAVSLLQDQGLEVVCAENGAEGVQAFSDSAPNEFSEILMDVRMPVMDGIEAAKAIRALKRPDAKTVPILAMTADAFAEDVRKCLDAGMNGHIAKPIDPEKLFQALQSALLETR